jgi:hypothetical protein
LHRDSPSLKKRVLTAKPSFQKILGASHDS